MLQANLNKTAVELAEMNIFSIHSETEVRYGCTECYGITKHFSLYATLEEAMAHNEASHTKIVGKVDGDQLV